MCLDIQGGKTSGGAQTAYGSGRSSTRGKGGSLLVPLLLAVIVAGLPEDLNILPSDLHCTLYIIEPEEPVGGGGSGKGVQGYLFILCPDCPPLFFWCVWGVRL